jgi:hypothetical protein
VTGRPDDAIAADVEEAYRESEEDARENEKGIGALEESDGG